LAACSIADEGSDFDGADVGGPLGKADQADASATIHVVDHADIPADIDPVGQVTAHIDGDVLVVSARTGGGCEEHELDAYWNGMVMETFPPQVNLRLIHDANGDTCEALITIERAFDLRPLIGAGGDGPLVIHLAGLGVSESLTYEPDDDLDDVSLAGMTYSRTFVTEPIFGQPGGERTHSLAFDEDFVVDNADTFFGNPPSTHPYRVVDGEVQLLSDADQVLGSYALSADMLTLTNNETGAVLTLEAPASGE
jgi:hypothetical protein